VNFYQLTLAFAGVMQSFFKHSLNGFVELFKRNLKDKAQVSTDDWV
jgi:hypothetical protein